MSYDHDLTIKKTISKTWHVIVQLREDVHISYSWEPKLMTIKSGEHWQFSRWEDFRLFAEQARWVFRPWRSCFWRQDQAIIPSDRIITQTQTHTVSKMLNLKHLKFKWHPLILNSKATGEELVEEEVSELQEALALVKEEDNSLELTTLMDLLLGDLKKSWLVYLTNFKKS